MGFNSAFKGLREEFMENWKLSRARQMRVKNFHIEFYENPNNDLLVDTGSDTKRQAGECAGHSLCYLNKS